MSEENILIEKIKVLDLHDGDIVVLLSQRMFSKSDWHRLRDDISGALSIKENRVLLLEGGLDIKLIRTETLKAELAAQESEL